LASRPLVDFVVWAAASAGSGVLGSAVYDGLKLLIAEVRQRRQTGEVNSADQPVLVRSEAIFLARLAVRVVHAEQGLGRGQPIEVIQAAWSPDDSNWRVRVRDRYRTFRLTIPDGKPEDALVYGLARSRVDRTDRSRDV
jgi:hypothetical protein